MTDDAEEQGWATAKTLATALPYIQIYDREVVTIKYGGHAMGEESVATGGMIPSLEPAIAAVESGVEAVVILDGRRPHAMLTELFTEHGSGTLIRA